MIEEDSKFLERSNIIDYSLLLGIHIVDDQNEENKNIGGIKAFCDDCNNLNKILEILEKKGNIQNDSEEKNKRKELRLFVGIIDILQSFIPKRQIEAGIKALKSKIKGEKNILEDIEYAKASITDPESYSNRFINFITTKIFKKENKE
uniref:PIPK domain-containing protein n=1 Tax=Meloidogyne incognita TaxID=6306 RepID=A0A914MMH3_MELIC